MLGSFADGNSHFAAVKSEAIIRGPVANGSSHLQNLPNRVHSISAASFYTRCAVGPWVSVAGRETALARGNPALRME